MPLSRLIIKYALLQLPEYTMLILLFILLQRLVEISGYVMWIALGLWVLKDIVLFPFLGRYYDPEYHKDWFSMIGLQGVVYKPLTPTGTVCIKGELWKAEVLDSRINIDTDRPVVVRNLRGLTLQVVPKNSDD